MKITKLVENYYSLPSFSSNKGKQLRFLARELTIYTKYWFRKKSRIFLYERIILSFLLSRIIKTRVYHLLCIFVTIYYWISGIKEDLPLNCWPQNMWKVVENCSGCTISEVFLTWIITVNRKWNIELKSDFPQVQYK